MGSKVLLFYYSVYFFIINFDSINEDNFSNKDVKIVRLSKL